MTACQEYLVVPVDHPDEKEHRRMMAEAINEMRYGKVNICGSITLTANQATSTLNDTRIFANAKIFFMPTTANAAAEMDNMYVSSRGERTATITHSNNAQTDRTFVYVVIG